MLHAAYVECLKAMTFGKYTLAFEQPPKLDIPCWSILARKDFPGCDGPIPYKAGAR